MVQGICLLWEAARVAKLHPGGSPTIRFTGIDNEHHDEDCNCVRCINHCPAAALFEFLCEVNWRIIVNGKKAILTLQDMANAIGGHYIKSSPGDEFKVDEQYLLTSSAWKVNTKNFSLTDIREMVDIGLLDLNVPSDVMGLWEEEKERVLVCSPPLGKIF